MNLAYEATPEFHSASVPLAPLRLACASRLHLQLYLHSARLTSHAPPACRPGQLTSGPMGVVGGCNKTPLGPTRLDAFPQRAHYMHGSLGS